MLRVYKILLAPDMVDGATESYDFYLNLIKFLGV